MELYTSQDVTNPFAAVMRERVAERQRERFEGWTRELVRLFPSPLTFHERVIIGSFAWTVLARKHKLLKQKDAVDIGAGWCTPADIARDYLSLKYPNRRIRMTTSQYNAFVKDRAQPPLHCEPCELEHALYVDIRSAYWSIVRAVGWDVNYNPSRFLGVSSSVMDFPTPYIKMARNSLVSVGLPGRMTVWTGERLTWERKPNKFVNLILWGLVHDVLNGVAFEAIRAGAIYAYTDGFIVPDSRAGAVIEVIESWGLQASIKHEGKAIVTAPATYTIGDFSSKVKPRKNVIRITKAYDPDIAWLKPRFRHMSERNETSLLGTLE